jgi:hypothetical protein
MPEFILDHGSPETSRAFASLDAFTQGYIEALFFTSTGTGDDGDLADATLAELAPETLDRIKADCARFQAMRPVDLDEACDEGRIDGYGMTEAGRDFLYTRNGHGCGFWEQDGAAWDSLDRAAKGFSQVDLYRGDDGLLYLM